MAWYKIPLFAGLVTSATDHKLTMAFSNGGSGTEVPGGAVVEVRKIWATNVDTARRTVSVWFVPTDGAIGDASRVINAVALLPNMPTLLFDSGAGDGLLLTGGMEVHAACSVANKAKLDITARIDDQGGGQIVM